MHALNVAFLCIGLLMLVAGLYWLAIQRLFLTAPLLSLIFGVVVGPIGLGWLDPQRWGKADALIILEQAARLTLALSLMEIAIHIPRLYVWHRVRSLGILLLGGMVVMWVVNTSLAWAMLSDGSFLWAMLLGALMTPTDPVLAGTIVTGEVARRQIRPDVRHLLYAEAGGNDGLAYLFVFLPLLLLMHGTGAAAWQEWVVHTLLWEVLAATAIGAAVGLACGKLQLVSERFHLSEQRGMLALTLALTLTVLGAVRLLGGDGLLAVFVAGLAFKAMVSDALEQSQEQIQDTIQRFIQLPIFVLLGLMIPLDLWLKMGWREVLFVIGILALRRPIAILLLKPFIPELKEWRYASLAGWFGPIGISTLFYLALVHGHRQDQRLWALIALVVTTSVVLHGLSATPLTRLLGEQRHAGRQDSAAKPAAEDSARPGGQTPEQAGEAAQHAAPRRGWPTSHEQSA